MQMVNGPIGIALATVQELPDKAMLSSTEIERADNLKVERRRQQYTCGRALLRTLLQHYTGQPAATHRLTTSDSGKPLCVDGPAVSIAHTGDIVLCALTDQGDIGVDIEQIRQRKNLSAISSRYFAADEVKWLTTQKDNRFYMLWVLKEAWLKATGTGIAGGLDQLRCTVTPPDIDAQVAGDTVPALSLYALNDMFIGAASSITSHNNLEFYHWDPQSGRLAQSSEPKLVATARKN